MRTKKWVVQLAAEEQQQLEDMLRKGSHNSRVLLLAHENRDDEEVAAIVGVTTTTVANIRRRYVQEGLEAALYDRPHPRRPPRLNGHQEAYLLAPAQSTPPEGRRRWTLRLVALGVVEGICPETVRKGLRKTKSNPGSSGNGASRP